jgi:hypothetical protein
MLGSSVDGRRDRTETTQDITMTDQAPQTSREDRPRPPARAEREAPPAIGDTIGTGTSIALGCVAATLLLIVLGLLFIVVMTVLN